MTTYREEGHFVIRLELSAEFDADYEGDDDGYEWLRRWQDKVRPHVLRAVFDALRADRGFDVVPVSRGKNPEDEVEISIRFRPDRAR